MRETLPAAAGGLFARCGAVGARQKIAPARRIW